MLGFRTFGPSEDHSGDPPQVPVGMVVTRTSIPIRVWSLVRLPIRLAETTVGNTWHNLRHELDHRHHASSAVRRALQLTRHVRAYQPSRAAVLGGKESPKNRQG